ncbi:DUF2057 family protein [Grimontia kaedaensis]|uniref:UPF0319 protein K6Q96_10475 n=1 Tax=Grimontia kaedaensis TaxID=2872157 RepID=A0ABY4WS41_9GAMM|nr:DUF2057 family protein [Grimontia kaedaensis]USH01348.1 DUF2057 family protein [Grimontia kaedaensis]
MKRKFAFASVLTALLSFGAHADVKLNLNDNVELLTYNGKTHKSSVFGKEESVVLQNGTQQVAFRYVESFEGGKDVSFVRSDVLVVKFYAADTEVFFDFPEHKNKRQVRQFNDNPEFAILDTNESPIAFEQNKLLKSGFQLSRDYLSEMQRFNQTDAPASLQLTASEVVSQPKVQSNKAPRAKVVVGGQDALNEVEYQLHYWFEKADAETQARFKAFLNAR